MQFLDLEGCFNFRDLGGYLTADGLMVAHRRLYRADALHRLTAAGRAALDQLRIATVIDLRTTDEVSRRRWAPPAGWDGRWLHLPLRGTIPDWTVIPAERSADPATDKAAEKILMGRQWRIPPGSSAGRSCRAW